MSKSKSKAKRPPAKPARKATARRQRVPRDAAGHLLLFDPRTGKPTLREPSCPPEPPPTPEQIVARRERMRQRLARDEARRAAFKAREARRPREMQDDGYTLPADVWAFLRRFFRNPLAWNNQREQLTAADAHEMIEAAYMEGCRQGFIEGRVLDLEPKRQRSAKANAAKRQKPREHNGMRYTLDQRDAAIVAEYAVLRPMMGATEAQYRLAEKYDLTDKMIRIIVGKAKRASR